ERDQSARYATGSRVEGVHRRGSRGRCAARRRRPAASLRSPRDDDARRRRGERTWRAARLEFRGSPHGKGSLARDRRARRTDHRRRTDVARSTDRAHAGARATRQSRTSRVSAVRQTKYVFVTGGVVSALGKGIVAASLGRLLKARGLQVQAQKFDPYLNVDPGTMSPFQHGEVFVTEDGAETDLDIGH